MHIALSWDLIIILFVALVVAYSFIVGKDASVKIIVATYIALVAVQAVGNIIMMLLSASTASMVGLTLSPDILSISKLVLFAATIVFMAIKGGIEIKTSDSLGTSWDIALSTALGFSTAGLLLSSLVTYIAGRPILDMGLGSADVFSEIVLTSPLVNVIVQYQHIWFALPAILLMTIGFLGDRESA